LLNHATNHTQQRCAQLKKITVKIIKYIFILFSTLAFCQTPDITGTAIDTSNYSFKRIQIRMESRFIENDSTNGERYFNRAKLYSEIREYETALKDFNKSAKLLPNELAIYYYRGSVYDNLKDFNKAIIDYNKVIELKSDFEWAYTDRGMMYFEIQDYEKAENDFKKALELKPNWTIPLTNLGKVYAKKNEFEKAIEYYERAIQSDSKNHLAYQNLGYVYFLQEKYNLAIKSYTKAIDLFPKYYNAIRSRADAKKASGDFSGFCQDLKLAAKLGDTKAIAFLKKNNACGK
jgi:tetratricopeptide (TPR) repeat protein